MNIKQEYQQWKQLFFQGGELFFLRLRLLGLDAREQLAGMMAIVAMLLMMAVLALIGLLALLLGLNVVLSEESKMAVFFGLAGGCAGGVVILCIGIICKWKRSSHHIQETLADMQGDWQTLRGQMPIKSLGKHDE